MLLIKLVQFCVERQPKSEFEIDEVAFCQKVNKILVFLFVFRVSFLFLLFVDYRQECVDGLVIMH